MKHFTKFLLLTAALLLSASAFAQKHYAICPEGTTEQLIEHEGYTVSYNEDNLTPNWSAWVLTVPRVKMTEASRADAGENFQPDPYVKGRTAITTDYSRSGYDRGHMAPAADMKFNKNAMIESFYLSNICPQDHELNAQTWCDLEKRCRYWTYRYEPITIICGPIYDKEPKRIGKNKVAVPKGFFKVVCKTFKGNLETIGFVFPNKSCTDDFRNYACTVSDVEHLTGIEFFTTLTNVPKDQCNLKYWQ